MGLTTNLYEKSTICPYSVFYFVFAIAQEAETYFKPIKYRNIGPFLGGRSVAVSGVLNDPLTYYMGTTGGGLWKTEDAGIGAIRMN